MYRYSAARGMISTTKAGVDDEMTISVNKARMSLVSCNDCLVRQFYLLSY